MNESERHRLKIQFSAKFAERRRPMIIISSGFPKSASTLLFFYTEEFLLRSSRKTAQEKFRRQNPEGFISHFGILNTLNLLRLSVFHGDVVVKSHAAPTFFVKLLINLGLARAYYSIRDPRDAMLSALDHAEKARTKTNKTPSDIAFAPFHSRADLYPALRMHFERFRRWKKFGKALFVRYENLLASPEEELDKLLDWLGRSEDKKFIPEVVAHFSRRKNETRHFNKGVLSRFSTELTQEEIREIESQLGDCIREMNYPLTQAATA
jgi:hypothetical protein